MSVNGVQAPQMSQADLIVEQRRLNQESMQQSLQMMRFQQEQNKQQEALSMLSNTIKNAHDAKMNIINNAKG